MELFPTSAGPRRKALSRLPVPHCFEFHALLKEISASGGTLRIAVQGCSGKQIRVKIVSGV